MPTKTRVFSGRIGGLLFFFALSSSLQAASTCNRALQQIINTAAPSSTVNVPACIYREQVVVNKPLTLNAAPGAEIRGSDVWNGWIKTGNLWTSVNSVPPLYTFKDEPIRCRPGTGNRCFLPEQVFVDGTPLFQVAANATPRAGEFKVVSVTRKIVLAQNPAAHVVEVTTRDYWIKAGAHNVTVKGFRMHHAANDAQKGALEVDPYSGWLIQNNTLSDTHGAVVSLGRGNNNKLIANDVFRGGQIGVVGDGHASVVRNNRVHHNNTKGFNPFWEAGGLKFALSHNALLDGNQVYANSGPGIWCDISCVNAIISNNRVHHNTWAGIFFEISDGANIYGNRVWENGWCYSDWGSGAGILVASSRNAKVHHNTVAWNADGITVFSQIRKQIDLHDGNPDDDPPDLSHPWNRAIGNQVHDNVIIKTEFDPNDPNKYHVYALAWLQDWAGVLFRPASNNRGMRNRYWYPNGEGERRFAWTIGSEETQSSLAAFNATLGEEHGAYVSLGDKNRILTAANMPLAPQRRVAPCR
jgi:parallel beta-helix repeat protein